MWVLSVFADGLAGEADAEFLEDLAVYFAGHHGGVHRRPPGTESRSDEIVEGSVNSFTPWLRQAHPTLAVAFLFLQRLIRGLSRQNIFGGY